MGATRSWLGSCGGEVITAIADAQQALAIVAIHRGITTALTTCVALSADARLLIGSKFCLRSVSHGKGKGQCDNRNG